ncbi:HdeD family acid-resistance protein [Liquorilactobacillus oeni]|uniref:Conserved hypothetical membrane spanning protein n=1 Tax=Liquorilactobacillus oeni DSM 19972 TaxID=1423777 RepID=A0A0R1M906_9LACO|nr:DUF308 domain-containing protein [Liquorilactobacillus oeni]KRL04588.1 conserved hypothetical membrane spanning protein [Liquorilactobacillus oeni DSM 19972]
MKERLANFDLLTFIVGVLSIATALICLRNPLPTFGAVVVIIGILAILRGLLKLFIFRPLLENSGWFTFSAVLDVVIGLLMLFNTQFGTLFVTFSFAFMFLIDSLANIWFATVIRRVEPRYFITDIIVAVLGIFIGVLLLISPALSIFSISFLIAVFFMLYGIEALIHAI